MTEGRLPTAPGAIADLGVVRLPNEIYATNSRIIFFDEALTGSFQRRFNAILSQPRYFRLRDNLEYFAELYQKIAAERLPLETYVAQHVGIPRQDIDDFRSFYRRYNEYIDAQLHEVRGRIAQLNGLAP